MRLGISSLFAENLPLFDYFPAIQTTGIKFLEVYCYDYPPSLDENYWRIFAERTNENHIEVYSFHTPFVKDISSLTTAVRKDAVLEVKKSLWAAKFLGAKFVIVHPGTFSGPDEKKAKEQASLISLQEIYADCVKNGLKMAVENMPLGYVGGGVEGLGLLVDRLPAEAGVCLDTGHSFLGNVQPGQFVRYFGGRLFTLHVHDNNGLEDQHFLPGEGKIRWPDFILDLRQSGFGGVFTMEIGNYLGPEEILRRVKSIGKKFLDD